MPTKYIDGYEIEFTAEPLIGTEVWGAYVEIFVKSDNPMHLANIYPKQRVAADVNFPSEQAAQTEAEKAGMEVLNHLRSNLHGQTE
jgi:hypothetical protein